MTNRHRVMLAMPCLAAVATIAFGIAGCATAPTEAEITARATTMLKASFNERGQAKLDRLDQDETQRQCTAVGAATPTKDVANAIEAANRASIAWPADGKYLGDWKNGEKIAQEGRGMQYSDDPKGPVGANCYACHQITKEEISFGTIGPSLVQFGKSRGYSIESQKYAFGKIYNAQAYSACTNMPRFGHKRILTEAQIKDVVALLMDPASPVNR